MSRFRKNQPVLTATLCDEMENLRLAIEVLTGKRTRFVQVDFNTCHGKVLVGDEEKNLAFEFVRDSLLHFTLDGVNAWNTAQFDWGLVTEVWAINNHNPHTRSVGHHPMWWVGRSATDRWEKPLYPEVVEHCAKERGLTVEEYLKEV